MTPDMVIWFFSAFVATLSLRAVIGQAIRGAQPKGPPCVACRTPLHAGATRCHACREEQ